MVEECVPNEPTQSDLSPQKHCKINGRMYHLKIWWQCSNQLLVTGALARGYSSGSEFLGQTLSWPECRSRNSAPSRFVLACSFEIFRSGIWRLIGIWSWWRLWPDILPALGLLLVASRWRPEYFLPPFVRLVWALKLRLRILFRY